MHFQTRTISLLGDHFRIDTTYELILDVGGKFQTDAVDPKSRHKGKLETEGLLESKGVNWTSIRPVYIYGPLNYNPVEEWFFHRLKAGRPIPIPNSGVQITQLGHVKVRDILVRYSLSFIYLWDGLLLIDKWICISLGLGKGVYHGSGQSQGKQTGL